MSETTLVQHGEREMAMQPRTDGVLSMIERLATMPGFDPANLEKLIDLHERTEATRARKAYFAAFAQMQQELPSIYRSGRGHNSITYAKNHDIQETLRPVLFKYGFGISFRTSAVDGKLRVVLVLAHTDGHSEESELVIAADKSGAKNDIQAMGSAQTYAQRYLTLAMLNITSHDDPTDDDGASAGRKATPEAPKGFGDFMDNMRAVADNGFEAFSVAWKAAKPQHRTHATTYYKVNMAALRAKAEGVTKAATA